MAVDQAFLTFRLVSELPILHFPSWTRGFDSRHPLSGGVPGRGWFLVGQMI